MGAKAYKKPFLWAIVIHLTLLGILGISITSRETKAYSTIASSDIVHATFISREPVQKKKVSKPKKTYKKLQNKVAKKVVKKQPKKKAIKKIKVDKKKAQKQQELARQKYLAKLKKQKEAKRLAAIQAQKTQGIVDKYKSKILAAISSEWLVPSSASKTMTCELNVQLSPTGDVLRVSLVKSSHNVQLDRSAISAVYKASPLPVPTDPKAFAPFKNLVITMRPENILG